MMNNKLVEVVKKVQAYVKLINPIRNAKYLKICNVLPRDFISLVECDLTDNNYSFSNIRNPNDFDKENVFQCDIVFVGYRGNLRDEVVKIDSSKSLINEFTISSKYLNDSIFSNDQIKSALIQFKIYHE